MLLSSRHRAIVGQIFFWLINLVLLSITVRTSLMALGFAEVWLSAYPDQLWNSVLEHVQIMFMYYIPALTVTLCMLSAFILIRTKRSPLLFTLFFAVELPLILTEFGCLAFNKIYGLSALLIAPFMLCCVLVNWYAVFSKRQHFFVSYLVSSLLSIIVFVIGVLWIHGGSGFRIVRFLLEENFGLSI